MADVTLSIIVPALNEEDNIAPLVEQVRACVIGAGVDAELIVVDDGSTDRTPQALAEAAAKYGWVRALRRPRAMGQSAAMHAGIQAARGKLVATLDADLQNDPADLPRMLKVLEEQGADLVQGDRSHNRRDNVVRRGTSWIGRATRRCLLGDCVRDTGCSARVMRASFARQLPLQFRGMHRFIPVYARMLGARVVEMPVTHRPRTAGTTKYGLGILSRGWSGFFDCLVVRWMLNRYRDAHAEVTPIEIQPSPVGDPKSETRMTNEVPSHRSA